MHMDLLRYVDIYRDYLMESCWFDLLVVRWCDFEDKK